VRLLAEVRAMHPDEFAWRREAYEFVVDVPAVDLLTGSPAAREAVEGRRDLDEVFAAWRASCEAFAPRRGAYLLYAMP
jgi:hypothetical protein